MASGTADLQRDLGGAIMQSIFGALLTAGYAAAVAAAIAARPTARRSPTSVQNQLTKSFAGAADTAQQYPQYADQITAAAKTVVPAGRRLGLQRRRHRRRCSGAALVFFMFPKREEENRLLARYAAEDAAGDNG